MYFSLISLNLSWNFQSCSLKSKNKITYCGLFCANDEKSGTELWLDLLNDGDLDNKNCKWSNSWQSI
jgi:hypothetical protein